MNTERKCSNCGTWTFKTPCDSCGQELDPVKLQQAKKEVQEAEKALEPTPKLDAFFLKWKSTKNPIFKIFYWIAYSVWLVYLGIMSFILFMVAWGPG